MLNRVEDEPINTSKINRSKTAAWSNMKKSPTRKSNRTKQNHPSETSTFEIPDDKISISTLKRLSNEEHLENVTHIELKSIDTNIDDISSIGSLLPSLRQLRLTLNVTLVSFRDLGTSLRNLKILWLNNAHVSALDGIGSLVSLTELYVGMNDIDDTSPLSMHETLSVLDLDSNRISSISDLDNLATLDNLSVLTLENNPIAQMETPEVFRKLVSTFIPNLRTLDDQPLSRFTMTDDEIDKAFVFQREQCAQDEEYNHMMNEMRRKNVVVDESKSQSDSGSHLTHGTKVVFAGNVVSALRRRRTESKEQSTVFNSHDDERPEAKSITDTLDSANDYEAVSSWQGGGSIIGSSTAESKSSYEDFSYFDSKKSEVKEARASPKKLPRRPLPERPSTARTRIMNSARIEMLSPRVKTTRIRSGESSSDDDDENLSVASSDSSDVEISKISRGFDLDSSLKAIDKWTEDVSRVNEGIISMEDYQEVTAGPGARMSDNEILQLLYQKPKNVPEIRTKEAFREFFSGISASRLEALLTQAYGSDKPSRITSRLEMMTGLLKQP